MSKASAYFTLSGIDGKHDIKEIKRELDTLHGVMSVTVSGQNVVAVDFDTSGTDVKNISKKIEKLGFKVSDQGFENHIM